MAQKFELPKLPYDYSALEPVIAGQIMELHYTKHHQTYVNNLNAAMEKHEAAEQKGDVAAMIALQSAIKFNGGGHVNHSIFWTNLAPKGQGGEPSADLAKALKEQFGSVDELMNQMNAMTVAIQGSGWGWLGYDKVKKKLALVTCANQDPLSTTGLVPLLGIDVWEHAYYLQYKSARADYLKAIWQVINWKNVSERYSQL